MGVDRRVFTNALVVGDGGLTARDIHVEAGVIQDVSAPGSIPVRGDVVETKGLWALPGAVDAHFHCRAPAHPERGDFYTESRAAAAGGVTTALEMPISRPATHNRAELAKRRAVGEANSVVDFALYGTAGLLDRSEVLGLARDGAVAYKVFMTPVPPGRADEFQGLSAPTADHLYATLELIRETELVCTVHAEHAELTAMFEGDPAEPMPPSAFGSSRPPVVEAAAIALVGTIARSLGTPIHIAHLSSALGLEALRAASVGTDVTAETCHHYLLLTDAAIGEFGPFAKVYPPLRTEPDQNALWAGLVDRSITMISSDHSPLTTEEKTAGSTDMRWAPAGLAGVEGLLPFLVDAVITERITLQRAVELSATSPAIRFGLYPRKGALRPGSDADIVLVDPTATTVVDTTAWQTKARDTVGVFNGRTIRGRLKRTYVRGNLVFDGSAIVAARGSGRFVTGASFQRDLP